MNKKYYKHIKSIALLTFTIFFVVISLITFLSTQSQAINIQESLDLCMREVDIISSDNPMLKFSSNPYDFTVSNEYYDKIVSAGFNALIPLVTELQNSDVSGLREYIICIAIEEITNSDMKQFEQYQWSNAGNFQPALKTYVQNIDKEVRTILDSPVKDMQEKASDIQKLGAISVIAVGDYYTENKGYNESIDEVLRGLLHTNSQVTTPSSDLSQITIKSELAVLQGFIDYVSENL